MPRYPNERTDPKNVDWGGLKNDPFEEGQEGIPQLEEEPIPSDILPDQIELQAGKAPPEDSELTARPKEGLHVLTPNEVLGR